MTWRKHDRYRLQLVMVPFCYKLLAVEYSNSLYKPRTFESTKAESQVYFNREIYADVNTLSARTEISEHLSLLLHNFPVSDTSLLII